MKLYPITIPGGSDTYVQYNNGGLFGGDSGLTYDDVNDILTINGIEIDGAGTRVVRIGQDASNGDAGVDNVYLGYRAGYNNSTAGGGDNGTRNVFIGQEAGAGNSGANNTGAENVGIGAESLTDITTGIENTGVGDETLKHLTTGSGNVAIGNDSMQGTDGVAITGSYNTCTGADTLYDPTSGSYNVANGYQCLYNLTTHSYNTAVGYQCLHTPTDNENVGIGYQAGYSKSGNRNVFVGYQAGYNNDDSGGGGRGDLNVYIGYQSGYGASGANNEGLQNVGIGYRTGYNLTTGFENVMIGNSAGLEITEGVYNFALGAQSLDALTTGEYNVAIGRAALTNVITGDGNVGIGRSAGFNLTSSNCVFIGQNAGYYTTSGSSNIAIGDGSGYGNNTGLDNVTIGRRADGYSGGSASSHSGSVTIGAEAGYKMQGGSYNVLIGYQAGYNTTSTGSNVYIGDEAGKIFTTGASNVMIGFEVGKTANGIISAATDDNLLAIGNQDPVTNLPLIEGYFAAHASGPLLMCNGEFQAGDVSGGNYTHVEADGDTYWVGDGSGLVFGHMYTNSTIATTLTDQNTWYELDGATAWTAGELNECTFTDPEITVGKAGRYEVIYTLSTDFSASPGAAQQIEYGIMIDGSIQNEGQSHRTLANSTDTGHCSGVAILDLAADADVSLAARNVTSAGKILHVEHGNMTVKLIGGT